MCLSRMWERVSSISATLNALKLRSLMHACEWLWVHTCVTAVIVLFCVFVCERLVICLVPAPNWLIQLFQIFHLEEATLCERWFHHLPHLIYCHVFFCKQQMFFLFTDRHRHRQYRLSPLNGALKHLCISLCIGVEKKRTST